MEVTRKHFLSISFSHLIKRGAFFAAVVLLIAAGSAFAQQKPPSTADKTDRSALPLPTPPFEGVVGKTYKESKEDWPKNPTAAGGASKHRRDSAR